MRRRGRRPRYLWAQRAVAAGAVSGLALVIWPATLDGQVGAAGFTAGATVMQSCDIQTAPLAFGVYDPVVQQATQPLDREASVTLTCTKGTTATIGLSVGQHPLGTARNMSNGSAVLQYDLFSNADRTQLWGDSSANQVDTGDAPSDAPRTFVVFGRIPPAQDIPIGTYTDSVVATVVF